MWEAGGQSRRVEEREGGRRWEAGTRAGGADGSKARRKQMEGTPSTKSATRQLPPQRCEGSGMRPSATLFPSHLLIHATSPSLPAPITLTACRSLPAQQLPGTFQPCLRGGARGRCRSPPQPRHVCQREVCRDDCAPSGGQGGRDWKLNATGEDNGFQLQ